MHFSRRFGRPDAGTARRAPIRLVVVSSLGALALTGCGGGTGKSAQFVVA